MECHLLHCNKTHFSQAQGTPFTTFPLSEVYNHSATTALDEDLFTQTASRTNITPEAQHILATLHRKRLPTIYSSVTPDILHNSFCHWDHCTSTSLSQSHLDHYHSLLPGPDPEPTVSLFWDMLTTITNLAVWTATPLNCWLKSINCMIHKDADNTRIDQLCVIHLVKANYNLLLCHTISYTLMQYLKKHHWLFPFQFGIQK